MKNIFFHIKDIFSYIFSYIYEKDPNTHIDADIDTIIPFLFNSECGNILLERK